MAAGLSEDVRARVEELGRRHVNLVYAAAERQLGAAGAEDVTQAVFLVALRKAQAGALPEDGRMAGWLLKVTRYAVRRARRDENRRTRHERIAAGRAAPAPSEAEALRKVLDEALLRLNALDREVVARRFLQGQGVAEVAIAVGLTENTAGHRIARALEKLRKILAHRGAALPLGGVAGVVGVMVAEGAKAAPAAVAASAAEVAGGAAGGSAAAVGIAKGAVALMAYATGKIVGVAAVGILLILSTAALVVHFVEGRAPLAPPRRVQVAAPVVPSPEPTVALTDPVPIIEVHDFDTGQPLAGVEIELSPGWLGAPSVFAKTNDDGAVKMPLPATTADYVQVTARKEGFVPMMTDGLRRFPDDQLPAKFSLRLEKATTIGGRVLDQHGRPLKGATVDVIIQKQYQGNWQVIPWNLQTTTDAKGEWTLNAVPAQCDKIQVGAYHDSCISGGGIYVAEMPIAALRDRTLVTTLQAGTRVAGLLRGPDGKPRKGWIGLSDQRIAANIVPEIPTSDDGVFEVVPPPGKPAYLVAHADGCASQVVAYQPVEHGPFVIDLKVATPLKARIVDAHGRALSNAVVAIDYYESSEGRRVRGINKILISDADGRISWAEAFNERLFVKIAACGYLAQDDIPLDPGVANEITMLPRFVLHATVVDDDAQKPASGFRVAESEARSLNRYTDYEGWENSHIRRTGAGTFDFTDSVQQDSFVLHIHDGGYEPTDSAPIITDGRDQSITIHVHKGQPLAGKLLGTDGKPLAKTYVYLTTTWLPISNGYLPTRPPVKEHDGESARFALTDAEGNFSLSPQTGPFVLVASNEAGYAILEATAFDDTRTMRLTPWAKIEGTVLIGAKPASNAPVQAHFDHVFYDGIGPDFFYTATTDGKGRFSFPRAFVGSFKIGGTKFETQPGETSAVTIDSTP